MHAPSPARAAPPPPSPPPSPPLAEGLGAALVLFEFTAEGGHEMSVKEGALVSVRLEGGAPLVVDGWLTVVDENGREGLVPESYLSVEERR